MSIEFKTFELALNQPLITGNETYYKSEGILLSTTSNGKVFHSEINPLLGFSTETRQDVLDWLQAHESAVQYYYNDASWVASLPYPSLRFGFDVLRLSIQAHQNGVSLSKEMNPKSLPHIKINGLVSLANPIQASTQISRYLEVGVNTIKVKVGVKPSQEVSIMRILCDKFRNVHWRIDGNQSFQAEEAVHFLKDFEKMPIEYCEQPVKADDIQALKWVKERVKVKMAADESAHSLAGVQEIIKESAADVVILKPMTIGSISEIKNIVQLLQEARLDSVFTVSMESAIGRRAVAEVAAALSSNNDIAHGLGTAHLFGNDHNEVTETIKNGYFCLE